MLSGPTKPGVVEVNTTLKPSFPSKAKLSSTIEKLRQTMLTLWGNINVCWSLGKSSGAVRW